MHPWTCDSEIGRIQDGAALEGLADAADADRARGAVDRHLGAGRHERALLGAAGQAHADVGGGLGPARPPAELPAAFSSTARSRSFFKCLQAEGQRIGPRGVRPARP